MGKVVDVAYEKVEESGLSSYIEQTKSALAALGSPDPSADVAAQKDYVVRARGIGLQPAVTANTIYALQRGFSPQMLREPAGARIHWTKEDDGWFGQPIGYGPRGSQWFFKITADGRLHVFDGAESTETPIKVISTSSLEQAKSRAQQELLSGLRNRSDANEPTYASDYIAVDSRGRRVWGPGKDYLEAKRHAELAGGVVKFEMGASEPEGTWRPSGGGTGWFYQGRTGDYLLRQRMGQWVIHHNGVESKPISGLDAAKAEVERRDFLSVNEARDCDHSHPPSVPTTPCADDSQNRVKLAEWANSVGKSSRRGGAPHLTEDSRRDTVIAWLKWNDPNGLYTDEANRLEDQDPLTLDEAWGLIHDFMLEDTGSAEKKSAKFERCVRHVKAEGTAVNPWAVCHAALGREPEPFTRKHVPWHKDDHGYYAEVEPYGKILVRHRQQDKRAGKLAWYAVVKKIEVAQGETRAEVSEMVEKHLREPVTIEAGEACVQLVAQGDVDQIRRTPACTPQVGTRVDSPKHLHAYMRDRIKDLGDERFWCVGVSKQGEAVGQPVEVAVGQYDRVSVDVAKVIGTAATLRAAGAESVIVCHAHPSGHGDTPSDADRDLTKRIRQGMQAIGMRFDGHYVLSEKHWSRA